MLGRAGSRGGMAGGRRAEEAGRRASEETGGQHRRVVATDAAALLSSQNVNRISLKEIVFALESRVVVITTLFVPSQPVLQ